MTLSNVSLYSTSSNLPYPVLLPHLLVVNLLPLNSFPSPPFCNLFFISVFPSLYYVIQLKI